MMRSLTEIDELIDSLLQQMAELQNDNGSFTTYYLQPEFEPEKGWMNYPDNSPFCTSSVVLPLLRINHEISNEILTKATGFLKASSFQEELWRFADLTNEYVVPFDTDSTALASFVLELSGTRINNKSLLDDQINSKGHYDLWVKPRRSNWTGIKVWLHNRLAAKCIPLVSGAIGIGDFEFAVTCNNLLYTGVNNRNKKVWKNVHASFANGTFDRQYYPSDFFSIYAYARACFHHEIEAHWSTDSVSSYSEQSLVSVVKTHNFLDTVLVANSLLLLNNKEEGIHSWFDTCIDRIRTDSLKEIRAFYCSNLQTDVQSDGHSPNTYFGSSAISYSLYLEFLNMYRYRFHGAYYSIVA
jgi:hypothetical protein